MNHLKNLGSDRYPAAPLRVLESVQGSHAEPAGPTAKTVAKKSEWGQKNGERINKATSDRESAVSKIGGVAFVFASIFKFSGT